MGWIWGRKFKYFAKNIPTMVYRPRLWSRYKSNGERKIADYLIECGFAFSYERPVALLDGEKTKIWYPDFYLDDYHILIEYLGMNANP